MSSTRAAYERAIQLHNAGDLDGLANLYTENAVLVTPDGTFNGRAAILEGYRMAARPFPDRTVTLDVIIDQGDAIAGEWTWAGTY